MPKFAANLTMLFTELAFLDRFAAAAQAGFEAVEILLSYDFDKHVLVEALHANRLQLILQNLPSGDWAAGERGIACHPRRVSLPNTAACQELFNAAAAGGKAWDHSGMVRVPEKLACHEIGQAPALAAAAE